MKHLWSIDKFVKKANVLQVGASTNLTTVLYSERTKAEIFLEAKYYAFCSTSKTTINIAESDIDEVLKSIYSYIKHTKISWKSFLIKKSICFITKTCNFI